MVKYNTTETPSQDETETLYITISEAAKLLGCSYSKAQQAVAECNRRQKALGLFTITGRCLRSCLLEFVGATRKSPFFDGPKGAR